MQKKIIYLSFFVCLCCCNYSYAQNSSEVPLWGEAQNILILNTESDDFAPSWNRFENLLYFNSTETGYSKFYTSEFNNSAFTPPALIYGDLNKSRNNQSYITFESRDLAYFSTYRLSESRSFLNLFLTQNRRKQWTKPVPLDGLAFDGFVAHPTVSPDGSIIIFSSDMNSGDGDTDLWMAFRQDNGSFGAAVNLKELNTPGNEITPFLLARDTLFFASDGQEGLGGYDLFISVYEDGHWQRPYPLESLNTRYDESDLTILPTGEAVFSSDRPGGKGKLDLYLAKPVKKRIQNVVPSGIALSISTQAMEITARTEQVQNIKQNIPYLFFVKGVPVVASMFKDDCVKTAKYSNNNFEINLAESFNYTSNFLKTNPEAKLFISPVIGSVQVQESFTSVKKYLTEKCGIEDSRITLNRSPAVNAPQDNTFPDLLILKMSSDKPIFSEILNADSGLTSLSPPVLEVSLDAKPRKSILSWVFGIEIAGEKNEIKKGNELPAQFEFNIKTFKQRLESVDSVILYFEANDSGTKKVIENLNLHVNHLKITDYYKEKINKKFYQPVNLCICSPQDYESEDLKQVLQYIESAMQEGRRVVIQYQKNRPDSRKNAEVLSNKLKSKQPKSSVEIETSDNHVGVKPQLLPYIIRVLIER
ncbi:MAG: hypothetical protein WCT77_09195 [Bacteroidota bacterium]